MKRRHFLAGPFTPALAPAQIRPAGSPAPAPRIYLDEFQPKTMLTLPEHRPASARFPVIDTHTHISHIFGQQVFGAPGQSAPAPADPKVPAERLSRILAAMEQLNLKLLVNLTGGTGDILKRNIEALQRKHAGRFLVCTEPSYANYADRGYPEMQARELESAQKAGAVGLKVVKTLGLVLRERITEGPLVRIDDPRFDPMWETAGKLKIPVFIHIADPDAFFTPTDRHNELYETLRRRPEWSFYGGDFPSKPELLAQRNRVVARHPGTTFVCLHVANHPENLDEVSGWLHRYPNMLCEIGARIGELGRQPRRARKLFEEFPDRILFGTDAVAGVNPAGYQPYFRFLETFDEYFDYASVPFQSGRWKIYGLGLPDELLKKVYHNNAARLLGLPEI